MPRSPVVTDRADVDLFFDLGNGNSVDAGNTCVKFEFKAMMNGGYMIRGRLKDANFNILKRLFIDAQYFRRARSQIFRCQFRLKYPGTNNQTLYQTAYVISLLAGGNDADSADLEFIAIDPPSWFLNAGNAAGRVYRGRVSQVIEQVINDYAPGVIADVSQTTDSDQNRFYMMRQDPKTFIASLVDWSASLTRNKTQWVVAMDDNILLVKEQAEIPTEDVGFYTGPHGGPRPPHIKEWEILADNALSIVNTKLVTHGISAVSGQYLDRITDIAEQKVFVKDALTDKKYIARTTQERSFTAPPDGGPPQVGWTSVASIPELYSAGDIGKRYEQYLDGRARGLWLNMTNMVMRCRFRVQGHGIYYSGIGLGTNTITVEWLDVDGNPFFLAGNWIIYGFHHLYRPTTWYTDLYCARFDFNAAAVQIPAVPPPPP